MEHNSASATKGDSILIDLGDSTKNFFCLLITTSWLGRLLKPAEYEATFLSASPIPKQTRRYPNRRRTRPIRP